VAVGVKAPKTNEDEVLEMGEAEIDPDPVSDKEVPN
jgi:hypothetical protein